MARREPGDSSAIRALSILDTFTTQRRSLTLSEISRLSALPLSTTHRQVVDLVKWGALERDGDGRYHVGLRLWEVGCLAPRSVDLREAALPYLEDLYEATRQNVQLALLDDRDVVYIERISGRDAVHNLSRPGSRLPLQITAVGRVLLAFADSDKVDAVLGIPLKRYTEHTVTDPAKLRRILADVKRDGYAIIERQVEAVSASVAAPVRDGTLSVIAALAVVVPADGVNVRRYVPHVVTAARELSQHLFRNPLLRPH
jgi:DNA-binding IclR family transcriptional regulator